MTRPLEARKGARNACVTLKGPSRLMPVMSCQSLATASGSPVKPLRRAMPALLTRMETRPRVSATSSATSRQAARSVTSSLKPRALPPAVPISAATLLAASPSMSSTARLAPSRAKPAAMARPMPEPAPVTTAMWPCRRSGIAVVLPNYFGGA